jgi:hypothetical protein
MQATPPDIIWNISSELPSSYSHQRLPGDTKKTITIGPVCHECSILLVDICIVFRFHISATTPYTISHAPYLDIPRFFAFILHPPLLMGLALPSKLTYLPSRSTLHRTTTHYLRDKVVHLSAHTYLKIMCPKTLSSVTLPHHSFTMAGLFALGPTPSSNDRYRQTSGQRRLPPLIFQGINNIISYTFRIWNYFIVSPT